jgi:hypothetical protein
LKARQFVILVAAGLVLAGAAPARAQRDSPAKGCAAVKWPALERDDPAYPDAVELARALVRHGFVVICVAPSKMTNTFEGQEAAALYRTSHGSFEVLILPKPHTFDGLEIVERRENGRYKYSFAGRPKPWSANLIDAPRPVYFIKHVNRLIVAYDRELATRLRTVLADL